jgi:pyruvate dehydrogenase E1 component alpha subunit
MGTYPQNKGQEANAVGSALAIQKGKDWVVPCYRENAALFMHGLPMHYILLHWMGDERGNQIPEGVNITPLASRSARTCCTRPASRGPMKLRGGEGAPRSRTSATARPARATSTAR